jgi:hypothetical protein
MTSLNALSGERTRDDLRSQKGSDREDVKTGSGKRHRITVSLSDKSVQAVREIKELTDADSDSEVFRNALRLYLSLLRGHEDGKIVYLRDTKNEVVYPIELFLPVK